MRRSLRRRYAATSRVSIMSERAAPARLCRGFRMARDALLAWDPLICRRGSTRARSSRATAASASAASSSGTTYDSASCAERHRLAAQRDVEQRVLARDRHEPDPRRLLALQEELHERAAATRRTAAPTRWPAPPCTRARGCRRRAGSPASAGSSAASTIRKRPNSRAPNRNGTPTAGSGAKASVR